MACFAVYHCRFLYWAQNHYLWVLGLFFGAAFVGLQFYFAAQFHHQPLELPERKQLLTRLATFAVNRLARNMRKAFPWRHREHQTAPPAFCLSATIPDDGSWGSMGRIILVLPYCSHNFRHKFRGMLRQFS